MNLIISIKPHFVKKILSKEKRYEFRKIVPKKEVEKIFIYSTVPDMKIVGYFEPNNIIKDTPYNLWDNFSEYGGISRNDFFDYFHEKEEGFAIEITNLNVFKEPINVKELDNFVAPQLFRYIKSEF